MHSRILIRLALAMAAAGSLLLTAACGDENTRQVDALFERWARTASPGCGWASVPPQACL